VRDALHYDRVTFTYPAATHAALADVDVRIAEGAFALAVGRTGAGKSTLLRAANGLVPHFSGGAFAGSVHVDGRSTLDVPPRRLADAIAFVPQDPAASFVLDRVEDELAYGMENLGVDPARMRRRVEEALDLLDIEPLRARSVRTLSGGERQRVAIGAALAAGPRILVLDEPTSQLDPQAAEDVLAALQRLVHDHGMTVLLAEHRLERVAGFVDRALGCRDGRVTAGAPEEIFADLRCGPPVARVAAALGWPRLPLTVRDARAMARERAPSIGPVVRPDVRPSPGEPLLRARALSAAYGDRRVVGPLDLDVRGGEVLAVMGRNGAGKTTLLRCLAGVHAPGAGRVTAGAHAPRPGVDVALCPQEPESILFADSVRSEVATTLRARAGTGDAHVPLEALGILDLEDRNPRDCSAGQRLLIATAAMVATGARVLLLDEPTRGLDPESKERLAAFVRSHAAAGGAVALATHDVELAAAIADRVVLLAGGEIVVDDGPERALGDSHVFAPQMTRVFGAGWLTPDDVIAAAAPMARP
jgi:energy-coupling factor transport system ATP-binding protein